MVKILALTLMLLSVICSCTADYWSDRENLIEKERMRSLGSRINLTQKEERVNKKLMAAKLNEYDAGFTNPKAFAPARHFFQSKEAIEKSDVFKFLKKLPKGTNLHTHDTSMASLDVLYNLTYWEKLYGCTVNNRLRLYFFDEDRVGKECNWKLLRDWRKNDPNFDGWLKSQLTMAVSNPREVYTDSNAVWAEFLERFKTITPMLTYRPVFEEYYYQALQELYDDNVMYVEFRGTLPTVYELDGLEYGPVDVVHFYRETTDRFIASHPDFLGAKFIYAPARGVGNKTMSEYVKTLALIKYVHGDFVAGFDLVGQEDLGQPLSSFIGQLLGVKQAGMNLFFHAGETNWYGSSTDLNLIDAVLLGTTRIGHGFALTKHSKVMEMIKARGIGVEVNPISNQVLLLVDDLRNHPGNYLFANDYPVVICNDDPLFWGAKALSYDWYEAFMGMTSREADLRVLKQLALNSIKYSALVGDNKKSAYDVFIRKWNKFISEVLIENNDI